MWSLTAYDRVLYFDADVLPLRPLDGLFRWAPAEGHVAAPFSDSVPQWHGGLFLLHPTAQGYEQMLTQVNDHPATMEVFFEMGWLNSYFPPTNVTWLPYWCVWFIRLIISALSKLIRWRDSLSPKSPTSKLNLPDIILIAKLRKLREERIVYEVYSETT